MTYCNQMYVCDAMHELCNAMLFSVVRLNVTPCDVMLRWEMQYTVMQLGTLSNYHLSLYINSINAISVTHA